MMYQVLKKKSILKICIISLLKEMRRLARLWSPDLRQIDLDVNRTYRDHLMFRERYGLKQQALFHILGAYSVYNSEIGTCFVSTRFQ